MHILNYELPFMYYRKHQSERLSEAPIREITGHVNPKIYRNRDSFVFAQHCGGCRKKNVGMQEEIAFI